MRFNIRKKTEITEIEENIRIKLEKSATSTKVLVYQNQPASPYYNSRASIQTNKQIQLLKYQCAELYFREKERQDKENEELYQLWTERFKNKPYLLHQLRQSEHRKEAKRAVNPSFISAVQQAILNGSKISKYRNTNYEKRKKNRENAVRDMIKNNFNETNTSFCTSTFDPQKHPSKDLGKCKKLFRNFILRLAKKYDDVKYLATFARQKYLVQVGRIKKNFASKCLMNSKKRRTF